MSDQIEDLKALVVKRDQKKSELRNLMSDINTINRQLEKDLQPLVQKYVNFLATKFTNYEWLRRNIDYRLDMSGKVVELGNYIREDEYNGSSLSFKRRSSIDLENLLSENWD